MFAMSISRRWGRWNWTVSDKDGKVLVFGEEISRCAARYQAARALFQLLLTNARTCEPRQRPGRN
jgi:phenylacetate-coenzyme A ligase PaaK-like adenylate-forming protein